MKIALISYTKDGKKIGDKLVKYRKEAQYKKVSIVHHYENSQIQGGIKGHIGEIFQSYHGIIFISAAGIAVRMISPYIKNKKTDPAVLVIDDLGRFTISLLSGHIGGGNKLTQWASSILGSVSVITTASDIRGIEAVDIFAKKNNYIIEDMKAAKTIMTMMVNGEKIGFFSEDEKIIDYSNLVLIKDINNIENISGIIAVSCMKQLKMDLPHVLLRPKAINIGIGCKRNTNTEEIIDFIKDLLKENNLSEKSIKALGTIEAKKDEKGIIEAAKFFKCPLKFFSEIDIKEVENKFGKSDFVKATMGVYSVAEPCAYLLGGIIEVPRKKKNGITLSISMEVKNG